MPEDAVPSNRTEWTLGILKIIEMFMSLTCLILHIFAVQFEKEPFPHVVFFCAIYGGYFFLSLAGVFVPMSGQKTPPGVDLVFTGTATCLYYVTACLPMYFAQNDPHLYNMSDEDEAKHPFFIHCKQHATWSLVTGTMFLMHAVICADRLNFAKLILEDEEEEEEDTDESVIDIKRGHELVLHIFILDWILFLYNLKCCKRVRRVCFGCCKKIKRRKRRTLTNQSFFARTSRSRMNSRIHKSSTVSNISKISQVEKTALHKQNPLPTKSATISETPRTTTAEKPTQNLSTKFSTTSETPTTTIAAKPARSLSVKFSTNSETPTTPIAAKPTQNVPAKFSIISEIPTTAIAVKRTRSLTTKLSTISGTSKTTTAPKPFQSSKSLKHLQNSAELDSLESLDVSEISEFIQGTTKTKSTTTIPSSSSLDKNSDAINNTQDTVSGKKKFADRRLPEQKECKNPRNPQCWCSTDIHQECHHHPMEKE